MRISRKWNVLFLLEKKKKKTNLKIPVQSEKNNSKSTCHHMYVNQCITTEMDFPLKRKISNSRKKFNVAFYRNHALYS